MPKIDANGVDCRNDKNAAKNFIKSLNGMLEKNQKSNCNLQSNLCSVESTKDRQYHSPKVFASDSITVNAPAKDVLGPKYNHFEKNLKSVIMPAESTVLTKVNGTANGSANGHIMNGTNGTNGTNGINGTINGSMTTPKLQPLSACYDRYPKPGSYGSLQVYPMNGVNSEINNAKDNQCDDKVQRHRFKDDRKNPTTKFEQDGLEEILKMCADYERQNQSITSSPIVQNRIKTNGSLPREKKSPLSPDHVGGTGNIFFPSSPAEFRSNQQQQQPSSPHTPHKMNTGYENVKLLATRKIELSSPSSSRYENAQTQQRSSDSNVSLHLMNGGGISNGYENVMSPLKSPVGYVPQSPRTRIKTCISSKRELTSTPIQRKTDYDLLVQSFEEKLRLEIQQLRDHHTVDTQQISQNQRYVSQKLDAHQSQTTTATTTTTTTTTPTPPLPQKKIASTQNQTQQQSHQCTANVQLPSIHQYVNLNRSTNLQEGIYGSLTTKHKNSNNHLTVNIKKNLDDKQIAQLKKQQIDVLRKARELKAQISELQRQEEEVLRELDLEKALVSAELNTEQLQLDEMDKNMLALQAKIHRLEAQRNANRVLQETQQNKLKQSIDMKQNQVEGLKKLINQNENDDALKDELNETTQLLENDTKTFEDLEFQYLEEETEWLAYREDLHNEQKTLSRRIAEKRKHIQSLEAQGIDNQNAACVDTKNIEKDLWSMLKELEKYREELKTIDILLYELSGEKNAQSDSDDDLTMAISAVKQPQNAIMSQSLFGSQEIMTVKQSQTNNIMSKSVNENLFSNKIEMLSFSGEVDHPLCAAEKESDAQYENITKDNECNEQRSSVSSDRSNKPNGCIIEITQLDEMKESTENNTNTNTNINTTNITNNQEPVGAHDDDHNLDPLQKLKYNLSPPFANKNATSNTNSNEAITKSPNLNLSIESDDFEVNPLEKRVPSQDDIDRICKVTSDAPISMQGASYKVIESIKEIERNRQLLLTQQGSHVIEHERQKMSELKKKCHDEARAQYLQLQNHYEHRHHTKSGLIETVNKCDAEKKPEINHKPFNNCVAQLRENIVNSPRHSHPEFEYERPLSEVNSEISYDALSDKQFKSSNDIRTLSHRMHMDYDGSGGSQRGSMMSSENSESGRMVSGARRSLPKHQRPLTRYLPIMSADLDLRLHIESAGHQVTLCPHVIIDSFSCRGYLHKLGATFHGWSKRWFVLDRQKMALIYYSDKSERKPRGGAYFSTIDEVYLDHLNTSKSGRPHCTFIVKTKRRSYTLQAASDAAARIWIDAIITGAQGNIDY